MVQDAMSTGSPSLDLKDSGLAWLNALPTDEAEDHLHRCCGSRRWVARMIARRPFRDDESLLSAARETWHALSADDWKEAFSHHPRIGDVESLKRKFASTALWAAHEQAGVGLASEETLRQLATGNEAYERRFGYVFIVCATGKSAGEMLSLLNARLNNAPEAELHIAVEEQRKIMELRLLKLLNHK